MRSFAGHFRNPVLFLGLTVAFLIGLAGPASASTDASASIIKGKPASISDWPWQVAIASSTRRSPGASPWYRTFCGGSVVAPNVVLTASHCALEMLKGRVGDYSVIAGRTNLNHVGTGQEVLISQIYFPLTSAGAIRYRTNQGWDVSLLRLAAPIAQEPIRLLGPDERDVLEPGRRLIETGWGTTITGRDFYPKALRVGKTNIQPGSICRSQVGAAYFASSLQICLGDSKAKQANCYGDSGGPAVVATTAGYRQVGVTSFGSADDCAGLIPNVDVLVGGSPVGNWIRTGVKALAGIDPAGSGGTAPPVHGLCRIPAVRGLTLGQTRHRMRANGCSRFKVVRRGRGNRISRLPALPGWLWDRARPIRLVVGGS